MAKMTKEHKVMREFKEGKLHSGSKEGPVVTSRKQAVAIALSEAGHSYKDKQVPKGSHKKVHHSPTVDEYDMQKISSLDHYSSEEI